MSTEDILKEKGEAICKFIEVTNEMAKYLQTHTLEAQTMYYDFTKEEKSELMDKIIEDTIPRFETDIKPDAQRWKELYNFLEELEVAKLSETEYEKIWN
jgi:ABC-type nitrate/sulfonate/bicarbonate transport system substrate-binding protein